MNAHRRSKIPACALVGVIASIDELRLATRMRAPPDLFELRLDHLPNLRESQLLPLRRPNLLLKFLPQEKLFDIELLSLNDLRAVWAEARGLRGGRICSFTISSA